MRFLLRRNDNTNIKIAKVKNLNKSRILQSNSVTVGGNSATVGGNSATGGGNSATVGGNSATVGGNSATVGGNSGTVKFINSSKTSISAL